MISEMHVDHTDGAMKVPRASGRSQMERLGDCGRLIGSDGKATGAENRPREGTGLPRQTNGRTTPVGWAPPRGQMDHPEWVAVGHRLGGISRCNQWWLGDWLRYGTAKWGEKYVEAARITGYDVRSLANMASIAAAFAVSRRRDNLTWSHHAAVVGLPPDAQEGWLDRAIAERLSVSDLRIELRSEERREGRRDAVPSEFPTASARTGAVHVTCPRCGYEMPPVPVTSSGGDPSAIDAHP